MLIDRCLTRLTGAAVAVREREVGGVVRHGVTLGLDAEAHVRQCEVGRGRLGDGNALYAVALVLVDGGVQRVVQFHIRVQRIILRPRLLLGDRVVERRRHLHLVGEELAQLEIGSHRVCLVVVGGTLGYAFFQSAKALGDNLTRHIDSTHVGELDVQVARSSPATLVDDFLQAQLVDPHLTRLRRSRQVAHTYHHRLHLAQRRIAHDGNAIVGIAGIVVRELHGIAGRTQGTRLVAGLLELGEQRQVDVQHVLLRPYGTAVLEVVLIIVVTVRGQFQGDEVLIIVVAVVTAQTHEDCQLVVAQSFVVNEVVGMDEHLHVLVAAQVERGVAVDRLRLSL